MGKTRIKNIRGKRVVLTNDANLIDKNEIGIIEKPDGKVEVKEYNKSGVLEDIAGGNSTVQDDIRFYDLKNQHVIEFIYVLLLAYPIHLVKYKDNDETLMIGNVILDTACSNTDIYYFNNDIIESALAISFNFSKPNYLIGIGTPYSFTGSIKIDGSTKNRLEKLSTTTGDDFPTEEIAIGVEALPQISEEEFFEGVDIL